MSRAEDCKVHAPLRVLLVEDEMLVALTLEEMLTDLGHNLVGTAANVGQALKMVTRASFDFALLDVNLNGTEVYPVAELLSTCDIPFAFSTGYGQRSLRPPFQNWPVLAKPVGLGELEKVIAAALTSKITTR